MLSTPNPTRRFRSKKQQAERIATRKLVCFVWANEQFAIAIEHTQYILREFKPYGRLENGCSLVRHHDEIITLVDLSKILSNQSVAAPAEYLIVCAVDQQKVGIAVSHLPTILEVSEAQFSEVPAIYQKKLRIQALENLVQTAEGIPIFCLKPNLFAEL